MSLWSGTLCINCEKEHECAKAKRMSKSGGIICGCSDCVPKPITNAERIKNMTDEELAELFEMISHSRSPSTYTIDGFCIDDGLRTKRQWLEWLNKEL